jgi:hypothetical protein
VTFERARAVADAVLYEGYALYPYRASARKNQVRWQFGVVAPREWSEAGGCDPWWMQTECVVEPTGAVRLRGRVRFLQLQRRTVERLDGAAFARVDTLEAEGRLCTGWDEAAEREVDFDLGAGEGERPVPFAFPAGRDEEPILAGGVLAGRFVRSRAALAGLVHLAADVLPGPPGLVKVRVRVENVTPCGAPPEVRDEALPCCFLSVHTLLAAEGGAFVSLLDPPEWARAGTAACENVRTWPVLVGDAPRRDLLLSSPIILYDYPQVAPESPGDLFDATEIDEILTLRTLTLTDEEKREARATDPRTAAIIERVEQMPPDVLARLHGALRSPRAGDAAGVPEAPPWWDPAADASVSPDTDSVEVAGVAVRKGSRVRLCPRPQRGDAQDMFLEGRVATVEGVFFDVDDGTHLAVTLLDDPAAELQRWHGRYLYFAPDEVEPLEAGR